MVREMIAKVAECDKEIADAISAEFKRQQNGIELIASENVVSEAVLAAMGSVLTNKYAEGYPSKRYYGGCQFVDEVETLAIERAKKIFGAAFANVQPHSGAQANMAAYFALLQPQSASTPMTFLGRSRAVAMTTVPAPMETPLKKLIIIKIRLPEELTAARASSPMKKPTHQASKALYSCWNTLPSIRGSAKDVIREMGFPRVISNVL